MCAVFYIILGVAVVTFGLSIIRKQTTRKAVTDIFASLSMTEKTLSK